MWLPLPGTNAYGHPNVEHKYTAKLPVIHEVFHEMRGVADQYPGGVLIGEIHLPAAAQMETIYGAKQDENNLPMGTADYSRYGKQATTLLSTFAKPGSSQDPGRLVLPAFGVFIGTIP